MKKEIKFSKVALMITMGVIVFMNIKNEQWRKADVISGDMIYYYIYLPAIFIYHDITLKYTTGKLPEEVSSRSWTIATADGKHRLSKMSCGYAAMLTPFFLTAHAYELLAGKPANGYDTSYSFAICMAILFYSLIALVYQRKILLHFFDEITSGITLMVLGLATNVYIYSTYAFMNPHIFGFCLLSVFVWRVIKWHQHPTHKDSVIIGLLLGLSVIVRPTNIVAILFPLLYGVNDKESLRQKAVLIKNNWKHMVVMILCFVASVSPQLIIWKLQTEKFIYYSYIGERFYFNHPHILNGLFSFRNSFFIYTPVMLLILPGFFIAWKRKQKFAAILPIFFAVNCYVTYSWWCWWYGGSFGSRAIIESYALLTLPLASTVQAAWQKNKMSRFALTTLLATFTFLNQFQTVQSQTALLHYSYMSYNTYRIIFLRQTFPQGYDRTLVLPDVEHALLGIKERDLHQTFPFLNGDLKATVIIKSDNGKFLRTDTLHNGALVADQLSVQNAERFTIKMDEFAICSFRSAVNNKYMNANLNDAGFIYADSHEGFGCQQYTLVALDNNKYAMKACNGRYVRPDPQNEILRTFDNSILSEDQMEIIPQ